MILTHQQASILYTIVVGTLDDIRPVGGISQEQRAALISDILSNDAPRPAPKKPDEHVDIDWKPNSK